MEELHDIARAHYHGGPSQIKEAADKFFTTLDTNKNGKIDRNEFIQFMTKGGGYPKNRCCFLFHNLDKGSKGALNFSEVRALYYGIKSRRPFCENCDKFIPGAYFTCVTCFQRPGETYNLCHECYRAGKHKNHRHSIGVRFLDNYSMLHAMREMALSNQHQVSSEMVPCSSSRGHRNSESRRDQVVPHRRERQMKEALGALDAAVKIGAAFVALGHVVPALCTIM